MAAAKDPPKSAAGVLKVLRDKRWTPGAHAWLYEVRSHTGTSGRERYADAVVYSCWPSRGLWLAGVEVKVARSDWKHELDQPTKSAAIQKFCDYWWVATPPGVVHDGEVPPTWGHVEVGAASVKVLRDAPKLEREAWSPSFMASMLRNQADQLVSAEKRGYYDGYKAAESKFDDEKRAEMEKKIAEQEREIRRLTQQAQQAEGTLAMVRSEVKQFEQYAGIDVGIGNWRRGDMRHIGDAFKAATLLQQYRSTGKLFKEIGAALEMLDAVVHPEGNGS